MRKILVYDFDKTLTKKDTLFGFFIFNKKKNFTLLLKIIRYFIFMVLAKFKFITNTQLKEFGIELFLSNVTKEEMKYKFDNYKDKIEYNFLFNKTDFTSEEIYIVSASFEEYLKPIFPKNVKIIASKLKYHNDNIAGIDFNCYEKNKINALKEISISKIDIFYTDSISDLPLVKISDKTVLIKNDKEIICKNSEEFIKEIRN
jgi:phosphoserine phosphatase